MPTTPPTITALGTPPSSQDSANFDARADALLGALPTFVTETNAVAANAYGNAVDAAASAVASDASADASAASALTSANNAAAAAASAGATLWASGSYATGARVWSPSNQQLYYRLTPGGSSPTDPASDPTRWQPVPSNGLLMAFVSGTSATVAADTDTCFTNAAQCAATVPALAVGQAFCVRFDNGLPTNTVDLGARSFLGPNGQIVSGVITITALQPFAGRWWGDYYRSL